MRINEHAVADIMWWTLLCLFFVVLEVAVFLCLILYAFTRDTGVNDVILHELIYSMM